MNWKNEMREHVTQFANSIRDCYEEGSRLLPAAGQGFVRVVSRGNGSCQSTVWTVRRKKWLFLSTRHGVILDMDYNI